jgi:4-oxalocrotonate tautomerase
MPVIRVEMFEGRTNDQKKELVKELTNSFIKTCGGNPEGVNIIIQEYKKEDWAVGGLLSSEPTST